MTKEELKERLKYLMDGIKDLKNDRLYDVMNSIEDIVTEVEELMDDIDDLKVEGGEDE